jgi:site-specific DNA recombinase
VRLIFHLALDGDGGSAPMGVKAIVNHLNARRIFTRDGGRWGIGQVHRILTRRTYIGEHEFNKRTKAKELKPQSEVVVVEVPPLIDRATLRYGSGPQSQGHARPRGERPDAAHRQLLLRYCGGAMTIRTGKGGRYRYYTCSIKARQGETGREGRSIPMDKLDGVVIDHIEREFLDPSRLEIVLSALLDRRQERSERRREHIAEPNKRSAETELRLKRLYDAIEAGVADLDDPGVERPHRRPARHS